ncbi:DedA family protein/thiosulfate sulfurtransferase GlpE [Lysobacter sp. BMK333-48F3]|uniref:DedA family protein/thiosulfate sulfurtransferase GlpE n=1 Tax=Lysobacter sp. BMK333-48F3 TaxID=2867962 RepID=UPI001C8C87B1|nr:DedA family protein/thiosulfate sulfurtransferase GlpE [Lysobacter sp. BMK333-48F3]MBX9400430.1 DedA family protein/thiosulfate sulfurtransferase GlpE [Lysobacter sp. BMK333-48F3]
MDTLLHLIQTYGLLVVFVSVLLDQGGLPVPAYPPIIVASAIAVDQHQPLWPIVLIAALAALLADSLWYLGGRRLGAALLRLMCKVSLSPDSCILMTRGVYARWGAPSLIVAKFVPGFAAVATTLAGETGTGARRFAFYDGLGALLWAGVAVAIGAVFHRAVNQVLAGLETAGRYGLLAILAAIAAFVGYKLLKRQLFLRELRMARISAGELYRLLEDGAGPLILDVRSHQQRDAAGWIPGAVFVASLDDVGVAPRDEVVVYCDCPNEASAATLARALRRRGFKRVRPLAGGFEAWRAQGHAVARG